MYLFDTGFAAVGRVALGAGGAVAAAIWHVGDQAVRWEAKSWPTPGAEPIQYEDDNDYPFGLAFYPRTGQVMYGTAAGQIRTCAGDDLEVDGGPLRSFALSPDGERLLCGCELTSYPTRRRIDGPSQIIGYTRIGERWTRTASIQGNGFHFTDVTFFPNGERFTAVEWSKQKHGTTRWAYSDTATLTVHDARSLKVLSRRRFRPSTAELAVCGESVVVLDGERLLVWELAKLSARPGVVPLGDEFADYMFAADPHGRFVLTASGSKVTRWDVDNWKPANTFDWKVGPITCLAVSPDGLLAAAGTATGKVVVWDVE